MRKLIAKSAAIILFAGLSNLPALQAQSNHHDFIGLAPLFQKTLQYAKGEYDVNVLPLYFETEVDLTAGFRLATQLNLSVRQEEKAAFKNIGVELALPIYYLNLDLNPDDITRHRLYAAPGLIFLAGSPYDGINLELTLFLEPGYTIVLNDAYAITAGVQLGKCLFLENESFNWENYLAIRLYLGKHN